MMTSTETFVQPTPRFRSRRQDPRIEIMSQLHGQLVAVGLPLFISNLGAGGFGVESSVAFPVGAQHKFRLTTATGVGVVVLAEAKHAESFTAEDGRVMHRAGFAFLHDPAGATERAVALLLDAALSVQTFQ